MEIAQILDRKSQHSDPVPNPFVEREALVRVRHYFGVPLVCQAEFQLCIDIVGLDWIEFPNFLD